jgi:hypothetical protein
MPYSIEWLVPNRVMYIRHFGVLTREELSRYLEESFALRDQGNEANGISGPLVHTITDARGLEKNEMKLKDVDKMLRTMRKQRVGWSIYVNSSPVERFLVSIAHQLMGVRYACFATLEEGLNFLAVQEDSLSNIADLARAAGHKLSQSE